MCTIQLSDHIYNVSHLQCDITVLLLQVQAGPLPEFNAQLHNDSAKQAEPPQTEAQTKVSVNLRMHKNQVLNTRMVSVVSSEQLSVALTSSLCSVM